MNLPSQKLFFIALPAILIVGLFILFHKPGTTKILSSNTAGLQAIRASTSPTISEVDTDGDGVPDWEEALWHTDPNNPRTFNNEPDADYINDQVKNQANPSLTDGPITSTDQLSQQLFAEYISLKQSGDLTPDAISAMTERLSSQVEASGTPKTFTLKDISTFPDTDSAKIQTYADTLAQTENTYASQYKIQTQNDNATFGDPAFANEMSVASDYYAKLAKAVIALDVPAGVATYHLDYANALMASSADLKAFANSSNEPLQGMLGVKAHTDAQSRQTDAAASITSFLNQNGIIGFSLPTF